MRIHRIGNAINPARIPIYKSNNYKYTSDTVSFRSITQPLYSRSEGDASSYFQKLKDDIYNKIPLIEQKNKFGIDEYKKLSESEKEYLRQIIDIPFRSTDKDEFHTIKEDMHFLINMSNKMKVHLDEKYPKGYNIVALGASCSIFAKIMEYQGNKAKILPFSNKAVSSEGFESINFKDYLNKNGIDDNFIKKSSKILFIDYVSQGSTFHDFLVIINNNKLQNLTKKMQLLRIKYLLPENLSLNDYGLLTDYFLRESNIKSYAPCPKMTETRQYKNIESINEKYNWDIATKLMNFSLIDHFTEQGIL